MPVAAMNERRLYYLSTAAGLIGLFILLIIPAEDKGFIEAAIDCGYNDFEIKGRIAGIQERGNISILLIEQNLSVVAFQRLAPDAIGKNARISARLTVYKGKTEIIAEEIKST
jgi:hypothetical protein